MICKLEYLGRRVWWSETCFEMNFLRLGWRFSLVAECLPNMCESYSQYFHRDKIRGRG